MNGKDCLSCDTYQLCKTYDRIPAGEVGCDDWEPARLPGEPENKTTEIA